MNDVMSIRCKASQKALNQLYKVIDPEIGLNIVDLGLVYDVKVIEEEKVIIVSMTLTSPYCPMGEAITDTAKESIEDAFEGYIADIQLTFEPEWSPEMISTAGQNYLNN